MTHATRGASLKAAVLAALAVFLYAGSLQAQGTTEDLDTQRFHPRATTGGYLQTEGSHVRYPIDPFSMGMWLSYGYNPLVVVGADGDINQQIISSQLAFDLTASYAFATFFELGLHLPLAYLAGDDVSEGALGDVRLLPKFRLLNDETDGIGLAVITELRAPTHTSSFYGGARMIGFAPRLLVDHKFGLSGFRLGLDLGVLIQEKTDFANVSAASELQAGLGMGYRFDGGRSPVELMVDLRSGVGLTETDPEEIALETLGGVGIDLNPEWTLNVGGGLGVLEGFGVPTFRVLAGVRWEPSPNDPDHDGVASPTEEQAEAARAASEDPEAGDTGEGGEDGEGGEGGEGGEDGEDGANADAVDDAARERAIRDGYDACPDLPEDYDGIEDEDGCPEGDNDSDGVLDYLDRCDGEEETINGFEDDDGCPDEGPAQILVEDGRITILETIRFEPNSDRIERDSVPILEQIALTLRKHKNIKKVEIGGHTDSTGSRELNKRLSEKRARAVRRRLVRLGIEPRRLSAQGFGPDKPIADNNTEEGRAKNRRVEFLTSE
ncbi:MAG: OmpA family protein [Myxococcales bacterium]|nr:OmpA family protein [Myxococcales bacterium]